MPLISVIVPVYKVEPYLRRCADSILAQAFQDFELILVDDGSPDNCGAICDEYAAIDSRIHVIHQQNGGLSAARNAGIDWAFENSGSEWLGFVDSDDWVHPEFLSFLLRAANENDTAVSACSYVRTEQMTPFSKEEFSSNIMPWDGFYAMDSIIGVIAVNKLYKKQLFNELRYPIGKLHEDEFLTYKLLYKAGNIAYVPLNLYYYYQNANSIMGSEFSLKRLDAFDAFKEQRLFAKKTGSKTFLSNRVKSITFWCCNNLQAVEDNLNIDTKTRRKISRVIRHNLQKTLLLDGRKVLPRSEYQWCYEAAFPKLSWCCWTLKGIITKMRKG